MEKPILTCKGLQYSYNAGPLFDFSFSIQRGQFCLILGKSGAGKSTLFSLLTGFLKPKSGLLEIDGKCVLNTLPAERDCSILFQSHNLFPHLTVFQNVALALSSKIRLNPEEKEAVLSILEEFELAHLASCLAGEISGGEMQRTAIARCLLRGKSLIFLDEPFSALDPCLRMKGYELLYEKARSKGITVLFVTHFPNEVNRFADRSIKIEGGRNYEIPSEQVLQEELVYAK
jgi:thiamine transport system ATP-binding protein